MESQRKNPEKKKRNKTKPHRKSNLWLPDTLRGNGVGRGGGCVVGRSGVGIGEKRSKDTNFQLINKYQEWNAQHDDQLTLLYVYLKVKSKF